jgi:HK97 family phage prohead protease
MTNRTLPDNYRPALSEDVPEGRACGNCVFYNEAKVEGDKAYCEKWDAYVSGAYYCNAWQPDQEERAPIDPDGYTPTGEMKEEAQRGLDWRSEFGRGGTEVGIARARDIVNGRNLPFETVQRMASFFARHEVDKQAEGFSPGEDGYPSNGRIAWSLWAGDSGKRWADNIVQNAERKEHKNMAMEFRQAQAEIRAEGDGYTFESYAALFNIESEGLGFREVIKPKAFSKSVAAADRGEWEVKALQDHDPKLFLGSTKTGTLEVSEDDRGLKVRVALNPEVSFARDLAAMLKRDGASMGLSFGFSVPSGGDTYNEQGVRELKSIRLHEISLLTGNVPAYPATIGLGAVRGLSLRTAIDANKLTHAIDSLLNGTVESDDAEVIDLAMRKVAPEVRSPWVIGADRELEIDETRDWDGSAAAERVFALAGFDGENPDPSIARRAFLVYDAAAPELRGSYKLGFADVIGGELVAIRAGLNAAASRLSQTDIPQDVMDRAQSILGYYAEEGAEDAKMDEEEEDGTYRAIPLSVRERQLALMALDPNRI